MDGTANWMGTELGASPVSSLLCLVMAGVSRLVGKYGSPAARGRCENDHDLMQCASRGRCFVPVGCCVGVGPPSDQIGGRCKLTAPTMLPDEKQCFLDAEQEVHGPYFTSTVER